MYKIHKAVNKAIRDAIDLVKDGKHQEAKAIAEKVIEQLDVTIGRERPKGVKPIACSTQQAVDHLYAAMGQMNADGTAKAREMLMAFATGEVGDTEAAESKLTLTRRVEVPVSDGAAKLCIDADIDPQQVAEDLGLDKVHKPDVERWLQEHEGSGGDGVEVTDEAIDLAGQHGVDPQLIAAANQLDRVTKSDVEAYIQEMNGGG